MSRLIVMTGPYCAGKSEFVRQMKDRGELDGFDIVCSEDYYKAINAWIVNHRLGHIDNFYEIMESRNSSTLSVRVDTTCQYAEGRYYVFRSDGKVYESWEAAEPIGGM